MPFKSRKQGRGHLLHCPSSAGQPETSEVQPALQQSGMLVQSGVLNRQATAGDLRKLCQKNSVSGLHGLSASPELASFAVPPEVGMMKAVLEQFAAHSCSLDGVYQLSGRLLGLVQTRDRSLGKNLYLGYTLATSRSAVLVVGEVEGIPTSGEGDSPPPRTGSRQELPELHEFFEVYKRSERDTNFAYINMTAVCNLH